MGIQPEGLVIGSQNHWALPSAVAGVSGANVQLFLGVYESREQCAPV